MMKEFDISYFDVYSIHIKSTKKKKEILKYLNINYYYSILKSYISILPLKLANICCGCCFFFVYFLFYL